MRDWFIENALESDTDALVTMWSALDAHSTKPRPFGGAGISKQERTRLTIEHAMQSPDANVLIARTHATKALSTIGTISGHVFTNNAVKLAKVGVIYSLWVEPEYRNRGIGHELVSTIEDAMRNSGAQALQVGWDSENKTISQWWQQHGYGPYEVIASKVLKT